MSYLSPVLPKLTAVSSYLPADSPKEKNALSFASLAPSLGASKKNLDEQTVSFHTAAPKDEKTSQDLSSNSLEAKQKKKKKKKTAAMKAELAFAVATVAERLNGSLIPPQSNPILKKTVSLFSEECKSYCPKFNHEEQVLLARLLEQSSFCDDMTLFEAFLMDFAVIWREIKIKVDEAQEAILNKELKEIILKFNSESTIFFEVYCLFHFYYGKNESMYKFIIPSFSNNTHPDKSFIIDGLKSYSKSIKGIIQKIRFRQEAITLNRGGPKIKRFFEEKFHPYYDLLNHLDKKINLLITCLHSQDVDTFLITKKTSSWSESNLGTIDHQKHLKQIARFSTFFKFFLEVSGQPDNSLFIYYNIINNIVTNNFNKPSIANCISHYKEFSHYILTTLLDAQKTLFQSNLNKDVSACIMSGMVSAELFDKWLNNIDTTISNHSELVYEGTHFKSTKRYVQSLATLLDQVISFDTLDLKETIAEDVSPAIKSIYDQFGNFIIETECELKRTLKSVSFSDMRINFHKALSTPSFRLSRFILLLSPIYDLTQQFSFHRFVALRMELLKMIQTAKNSGQLEDIDPLALKEEIKGWLIEQCFKVCTYAMIIAEANSLTSEPEDVLHLLPDELFQFLDLKGFDEIFLKNLNADLSSNLQEPTELTATAQEEPQELSEAKGQRQEKIAQTEITLLNSTPKATVPPKKTQNSSEILKINQLPPQREDFYNADKKRLIDKLLERMNCGLDHTTGSHQIFRHRVTNKIVVVPKDVSKLGTRKSIYNQAADASQGDFKQD